MKTMLLTAFMFLALVACGSKVNISTGTEGANKATEILTLAGTYKSSLCFKNKPASEGFGVSIYTNATLTFQDGGTGAMDFELFTDAACTSSASTGTQTTSYAIVRQYGDVQIVYIEDPAPTSPPTTAPIFIAFKLASDGAYFHIDGNRADAGAHLVEPSESDLAAFIAAPESVGVFFTKQ